MAPCPRWSLALPAWFVACASAIPLSATAYGKVTPPASTLLRATPQATDACDLSLHATRFVAALDPFRRGDDTGLPAPLAAAAHLEAHCGRRDPSLVVALYQRLSAAERARGIEVEASLDRLREEAADLPLTAAAGTIAFLERLRAFDHKSASMADVAVRAHGLSLHARLRVRLVEQAILPASELPSIVASTEESLALFRKAGHLTPTLEPLWILARCRLLATELDAAEDAFVELDETAQTVGRSTWRERAILGLLGLARERGSLFEAEGWLEELGSFREPSECWSLAREVAVQRLQIDDGWGALAWLEEHAPSELDDEISDPLHWARAAAEWHSLIGAAELRCGHPTRARARLEQGIAAAAGPGNDPLTSLTLATIHLESGDADHALQLLRVLDSANAIGAQHLVERCTLEGRALMALGRNAEAITPLERALEITAHSESAAGDAEVQNGSRMGEWLGLSAIESLGRAYVETDQPLRAAGLFEWTHAPTIPRLACESILLEIAGASDLGYVTWMVGADQTLALHVLPSGVTRAMPIPVGRRGIERAVQRLRDAIANGREDDPNSPWRTLGEELAEALFPDELRSMIAELPSRGATLTLGPHGVLERMPFEALLFAGDDEPLGVRLALSISTTLRSEGSLAPALEGRSAHWTALGAPATERYEDLPGARREIESIGRLQPNWEAQTGAAMTRAALAKALSATNPLHIATHVATFDGGPSTRTIAPMGFVVAGDIVVSAEEVLGLAPKVPLAILTACGSAEGLSVDGLSVRGMAQTMLATGTRSAIVTLWPIQDRPAERAAVRLHAALQSGASPAEATRRAREFLWQLGEGPSEWAAYRTLE